MSQPTDLDQAAFQLQEAKNRLDMVKHEVLAAEQHLIDLIGFKDEGTTTEKGKYFKIKTTGKMSRRIDTAAFDLVKTRVPEAILSRAFVFKPAIDLKGLRYLEQNEPEHYNEISRAVIAKPSKTAVSVELIGGDE